ncbi:MAG: hypothetical protein US39_C0012G0008 [Microgenomates group bacterium GW2011_GWC1_37_12b]|uniref:Uncharacterized protein n=1 Tax=Candidatus Woesebacteria bacterium GW2011_GWB1_38_8b TaxID=1618571 RepID=A0A0G0P9G6_9BACT|nr:MAG: hypothetical protein US39_C0012G0008 [Microgenomates group bacterium GW2011_GWC1_37_12b]KKQ85971.1 MAG: hypothetical protein UT10_C0033G0007 [Candidatus Woesebacteria bacterium GW2011_GWB1_38_8b]
MLNKKKIIIIILFLVIIIVGTLTLDKYSPKKNNTIPIAPSLHNPLFNVSIPLTLSETISYKNASSEIIIYETASSSFTNEDIEQLISYLKINYTTQSVQDVRYGKTLIGKDRNSYLTIFTEIGKLEYGHDLEINKNTKTDDQIILRTAQELLDSNRIFTNLKIDKLSYISISDIEGDSSLVKRDDANVYRVNIKYDFNNVNILDTYQDPASYIDFYPDGSVKKIAYSKINATKVSSIKINPSVYIVENLFKARLYSLKNDNNDVYSLPAVSEIENADVDDVTLIYLLKREQNKINLIPTYSLNAKIKIKEDDKQYTGTFLLQAI